MPPQELPTLLADENEALRFFTKQIFIIFGILGDDSAKLKKKWRVAATSAAYFRRFYAFKSLVDHDPRIIMLAAIFLAGKSENHFVSLADLRRVYPKASDQAVLSAEMCLLENLKFDLKVHHPQNCVPVLMTEMKRLAVGADRSKLSSSVTAWLSRCEHDLYHLQITSAVITYTPLTLAVFALLSSANEEVHSLMSPQAYLSESLGAVTWNDMQRVFPALEQCLQDSRKEFNAQAMQAYMLRLRTINKWNESNSSAGEDGFG